jgi:pyruvate dehydrogenase E1 component alpha subunit
MAVVARGIDPLDVLRANQAASFYDYDFATHRVASMVIPLATQAVHATGFAMAARLREDPIAVLTFLGDGAASEGDAHEAMNFAAVFGAPVVFLVVNNQWAISTPVVRQTNAPTFAHKAIGYGMPGTWVDGNDVLAVHAALQRALDRARAGGGPSLVEAVTYRMEAHTASDDPTRYRTEDEVEAWRARDPVERFERYLRQEDMLDAERAQQIEQAAEAVAARIRDWADAAPVVDPMTMFDHAYADAPPALATQRARLAEELAAVECAGTTGSSTTEPTTKECGR